jgi:hypothetical protein
MSALHDFVDDPARVETPKRRADRKWYLQQRGLRPLQYAQAVSRYVAVLGIAVFWLSGFVQQCMQQYRVDRLHEQLGQVEMESRWLDARVGNLDAPGRLAPAAQHLCMVLADPSKTAYIHPSSLQGGTSQPGNKTLVARLP